MSKKDEKMNASFANGYLYQVVGRRYSYDVLSRISGWKARYIKDVNADEETVRFWQEIYDDQGTLVEIHQKFPEDTGHQQIKDQS